MRTLTYLTFVTALVISFTSKAESVGGEFTTFAGFELGRGTLTDIKNKMGSAEIVETGDAGEYTASICYVVPNGIVLFFAGELDGPEHNLGGFGFAKKTDRLPCLDWPTSLDAPSLAIGGLRLGLSLKDFSKIVGVPVRVEGNRAYAFFEGKRNMSEKELLRFPNAVQEMVKTGEQQNYFDVVVSVVATFFNGHIVELRIWKTETT